ncbi:Periodic tryptophan protein 2, partial [Cucurbita argyrosperma subsp. sororia]
MNYRFQNLLGAPYRGGNVLISEDTLLISPVGNRISVTDLVKSQTATLPVQSSSNICRIAVSPDGAFLFTVDEKNRCLFINLRRRVVLHRMFFKKPVSVVKFSPDGAFIAVGTGKLVQIWRSPGFKKEFFPFELVRTFADCNDKVTALDWSPDGNYLLAGSKDLTVRLLFVKKISGIKYKPHLFLGHRDSIVGSFFGTNKKTNKVVKAYTITRDCYIFSWGITENNLDEMEVDNSEPASPGTPSRDSEGIVESGGDVSVKKRKNFGDGKADDEAEYLLREKWELVRKDFFLRLRQR